MPDFGSKGYPFIMAVRGDVSVLNIEKVVKDILKTIKMNTVFNVKIPGGFEKVVLEPIIVDYKDSEIGIIYIQPLFESFIAFDAWPKHNGGFLTVFSCKDYDSMEVIEVVERHGFRVGEVQGRPIRL